MSETTNSTQFKPKDYAARITKGSKKAGLILAIVLTVLGALMLNAPLRALIAFEYVAACAFVANSVFRIVTYFQAPKEARFSGVLVNAVAWLLLGGILLLQGPLAVSDTFAFLFGFVNIFNGITKLTMLKQVKEAGGSTVWAVISGIIDLATAFFFISAPFITQWAFAMLAAVYLIVGGVTLFIDVCTYKTK